MILPEGNQHEQLEPEILHTEEKGYLETEGMEKSWKISQKQLLPLLDKQSVRKVFDLTLDIGPFGVDYSRNGNYLLLTGTRGHVSLVDWKGKKLETELFLNETCHDSTYVKKICTKKFVSIHKLSQIDFFTIILSSLLLKKKWFIFMIHKGPKFTNYKNTPIRIGSNSFHITTSWLPLYIIFVIG